MSARYLLDTNIVIYIRRRRPPAVSAGAIRAKLETDGEMIGHNDLWIAAHARAAGLILVTNNEREFRRIRGLAVENWIK
jgi:tRNA(fMet)-specific endonuclease VapC